MTNIIITHPDLKTAVDTAVYWQQYQRTHPGVSLVLVGPNGTGKTHLARTLLWGDALMYDGHPIAPVGRFITANNLLQQIFEYRNQRENPLPTEAALSRLIPPGRYPIVVIDDVGHEEKMKFTAQDVQWAEVQKVYLAIFNHCFEGENRTSLIITGSNNCGTPDLLARHVGPAAWDRLAAACPRVDGRSFILDFKNIPSYRNTISRRQI